MEWSSGHSPQPNAKLGGIFWFPLIGGPKVARFFGFEKVSETRAIVPDVYEVSGAIRELNEALGGKPGRETIGVSFYPTSPDEVTSGRAFLERFADHGELPMATGGGVALHDLSYHLATIFIPNRMIEHSRLVTQRLLEFMKYAEAQNPPINPKVIDRILDQRVEQIDLLGDYSVATAYNKIIKGGKRDKIRSFSDFLGGITADGALSRIISETFQYRKEAGLDQIWPVLKEFLATHPDQEYAREFKNGDLVQEVNRKRGSIAQAVVELGR